MSTDISKDVLHRGRLGLKNARAPSPIRPAQMPAWPVCLRLINSKSSRKKLLFVTRLTRQVPLVEQELLTLSDYLSPPPVFSGARVTRSLVLCVCFVDRCL